MHKIVNNHLKIEKILYNNSIYVNNADLFH